MRLSKALLLVIGTRGAPQRAAPFQPTIPLHRDGGKPNPNPDPSPDPNPDPNADLTLTLTLTLALALALALTLTQP